MQNFINNYGSRILTCAVILLVGFIIMKLLLKLTEKSLQKSKINVTTHKFILSTVRIALWVLLAIIVLEAWGIPMTSLIAVFSVAGLAVSLAVKDSLANVAGGVILLFSKPFQVGDYVQLDGAEGTVIYISILYTKLNTFDNKAIFIPNGQISSDRIVNYSRESNRRLDLVFAIGYHNDFQLAKRLILETIENNNLALKDPAPVVRVCEHAASSINIAAKIWVDGDKYWDLKYDLLEDVKLKFDEAGINFPYQQMDVHLHKND